MSGEVIALVPKIAAAPAAAAPSLEETVATLTAAIENIDTGMKLMINVIGAQEKRLRALELAQRKADRKNVPVIVNARGEKVSS